MVNAKMDNPEEADAALNANLAILDGELGVVKEGVKAKASVALNFLRSKRPVSLKSTGFNGTSERNLSNSERRKLAMYYRYALNPMEILSDFKKGITRPEAVEALNKVWPEYAGPIESTLQVYFSTRNPTLKQTKVLSKLLGGSVDMMKIASVHAGVAEEEGKAQKPKKGKTPSAKEVKDSSKVDMTEIQRISN